ncbi:MAG: purine phosphoribosyltransferase [Actinomycetota bacterium]|nr:purine phosphoribosyltransferase [Actinomycetota bacterium]
MNDSTIALDLTWDELADVIAVLAEQVRADSVPDVVVGILRGGMVPAVLLAHQLGVRDMRGIEVTRTLADGPNGAKTSRPVVTNPASLGTFTNDDVLLVDDVAGSGDTSDTAAGLVSGSTSRVRRAVVVVNTINWNAANTRAPHDIQDYIGTTCAGWVRFPWEVR